MTASRGGRLFLVPEIHPGNAWLWWLVSWRASVQAVCVTPANLLGHRGRLRWLDVDAYVPEDDAHCRQAAVVQRWEQVAPRLRARTWRAAVDGHETDFTAKACQDLARHYERWLLLQRAARQAGLGSRLIYSAGAAYLTQCAPDLCPAAPSGWTWLSRVNVWCDAVWSIAVSLGRLARLVLHWLGMALRLRDASVIGRGPVRYLWAAANPNELHAAQERRSLFWIVDGEQIRTEDVVYVLPQDTPRARMQPLQSGAFRVVRGLGQLDSLVPRAVLMRCLGRLWSAVPGLVWRALTGYAGQLQLSYFSQAVAVAAIVRHHRIGCYISSESAFGYESPAVSYLNARGIPTVMYCYSANTHLPYSTRACGCDFRAVIFSHLLARHVAVWHPYQRDYLAAHPQDGAQFHVIGPLMSGDDRVFQVGRDALLERYHPRRSTTTPCKWVGVFDVTAHMRTTRARSPLYATTDPEYVVAFLRDMVRLLQEDDRLGLIFKPQRSLMSPKFTVLEEGRALIAAIAAHPRGLVLPDDINPWVPMALADACVGLPFTSPVQAGWFYGVPGVYHDPDARCVHGRCAVLVTSATTHSYAALRERLEALLWPAPGAAASDVQMHEELTVFLAPPAPSSTEVFRRWLRDVTAPVQTAVAMVDADMGECGHITDRPAMPVGA